MFLPKSQTRLIIAFLWVLMVCSPLAYASGNDSSKVESAESSDSRLADLWIWPFDRVVQPILNGLIYPMAKPIDYIVKNGVIEKSVDLITFGERGNILIYPSFNFKPGSNTMLGANYRHRGLLFDRDYLVLQAGYYANGDMDFTARYSKHGLFGSDFFGAFRFDVDWDRDDSFIVPETKEAYTQPDSSVSFTWRLGHPLNKAATWNVEISAELDFKDASLPDVDDSILVSDRFSIHDRGLYQNSIQIPLEIAIFYDNLDYAYAPSRGTRLGLTGSYHIVGDYSELDRDYELGTERKNHDFIKTELMFQHYFYMGSSESYILSAREARQNRKFYTDFSWDEAMRIWRPENVMNTLFERRVVAFQYRLVDLWEMEYGGAPYNAFIKMNARTPLRGYGDAWAAHHMMSFSWEYRWPVDRFVDGVLFDEYALIAPEFDKWSLKRFYNSWGFGIRVRQPNMYLFRMQLGFHGLHGVNLVMTIAPEFK